MAIKALDLGAQNAEIHDRVQLEIAAVLRSGRYVGGTQADAFEEELADYLGVRRVVCVSSGTEALSPALEASSRRPAKGRYRNRNPLPVPLHLQPAYGFLRYRRGDFPVAESIAETALSLPIHPHLSKADVEQVVDAVKQAIRQ
ncbi:MAG TPA: DegT/DnrJ/EryC1/StrS family aminotransferase [Candidatus Binataceae bacterium]